MFCSFLILEFFVVNMNFARIFASISLVFLLKMRPYFARIFTKMSPYEELGTLVWLFRRRFRRSEELLGYKTENCVELRSNDIIFFLLKNIARIAKLPY